MAKAKYGDENPALTAELLVRRKFDTHQLYPSNYCLSSQRGGHPIAVDF
jgi:hypothetical protein